MKQDGKAKVWLGKDKDGVHAFWFWWSGIIYEWHMNHNG